MILAGCALALGLASCEMKDELLDKGGNASGEMGVLDLSLAVNAANNVVTKAAVDEGTEVNGPTVSADGFELDIANADGSYKKTHEYDPENTTIELPVGDYTVTAHSPGECEATSTAAYYSGKQSFEIAAGETKPVSVVCKMANTKIQVTFDNSLKDAFTSWTVTVTPVGVQYMAYPFAGTSADFKQPDAIFWMLPDNVRSIQANFQGVNNAGENVLASYSFEKPASADVEYWTGADALAIKVNSQETTEDNPSGVNGVTIDAEVTWNNESEDVTIPVDGTPTEPTDPVGPEEPEGPDENEPATGDGEPSVSFPKNTYTLPADASANADAVITASEGATLTSVKVTIEGDGMFGTIIGGILNGEFLTGLELVGNTELTTMLAGVGVSVPSLSEGQSSYTFPVGSFFNLLSALPSDSPDGHVFKIDVTDSANKTASATLSVIVEATTTE